MVPRDVRLPKRQDGYLSVPNPLEMLALGLLRPSQDSARWLWTKHIQRRTVRMIGGCQMIDAAPAQRPPARGRLAAALMVLGLWLMLAPLINPVRAYGQNAAPAVCTAAQGLAEKGFPVRALALIDAAFQPDAPNVAAACPDVRQLATDRIDESFRKARAAQDLIKGQKWPEALAAANEALGANADNADAQVASQSAKDEVTKAPKSKLQELQDNWQEFAERELAPLGGLLVPFVTTLVALLVTSRLVVLLVAKWPALDESPAAGRPRRVLGVGLFQLVLSSLMLTFGLANLFDGYIWLLGLFALATTASAVFAWQANDDARPPTSSRQVPDSLPASLMLIAVVPTLWGMNLYLQGSGATRGFVLSLAAVGGVLGVFLTAWWLATRLRLEVKVTREDNKDSRAEAALVTALLYDLGAEKPRGLEVTQGADVTALTDALTALPDNVISKGIRTVLAAITGTTPWIANIEGDTNGRTVSVSRNGRTIESVAIDGHTYGSVVPDDAAKATPNRLAEAPLRMAAAFILFTLAKKHPSIRGGLAGASDWRSIGLQYVATTLLEADADSEKRQQKLAKALELDPGNLAAQLAFRHATERKSADARVLIGYRDWLKDQECELVREGLAQSAVLLRACYTRTVIATNAVFAKEPTDVETTQVRAGHACKALGELNDLVGQLGHIEDLQSMVAAIKDNSVGLERLLALPSTTANTGTSPERRPARSPTGQYNDACYLASKHSWALLAAGSDRAPKPSETAADDQEAIALLRHAAAEPELKSWMLADPQLREFRGRHAFRECFLKDPASDLYACEPIKPHAERLRAAGYGQLSILAKLHGHPNPLADVIPAAPLIRRSIIDMAHLHSTLPEDLINRKWSLEMLAQLASLGLASAQTLSGLERTERKKLATALAEHIVEGFKTGEDAANLYSGPLVKMLYAHIQPWLESFAYVRS